MISRLQKRQWQTGLAILWGIWAIALLAIYYRQIWYTFGPQAQPLPDPNSFRQIGLAIPGMGLLLLLAHLPLQRLFQKRPLAWGLLVGGSALVILVTASPVNQRLPFLYPALLSAIQGLGGAGLVLLAAQLAGMGLVRLLRCQFESWGEARLYENSLGLGLLAYLSWGLATVRLYNPATVQLLIGGMVLVGGLGYWYLKPRPTVVNLPGLQRSDRLWQTITLLAVAIALVAALAPEWEYDALWYHLGLPKIWLAQGYLVDLRYDYISLYPMTWELIFGAGLALGGAIAAKLLHFITLPLTGLLVFELTRRYVPQASAWLAVALLVTIPIVLWEATTAYVDLALAFHVGLVIYALLRYQEQQTWSWLILAALNLGLALATKHLALFVLALTVLGVGLNQWLRTRSLPRTLPPVLVLVGISLLLPLPWYLRSWLASGNPVFPELFELFGAPPDRWDAVTERGLSQFLTRFGRPRTLFNLLTLPWDMTVHATRYGGTLGPLLVLFLPVLLLRRHWSAVTPWLLGFVGLYLALWASPFSSFQMRFLVPLAPLLAVLAAEAIAILAVLLSGLRRSGPALLYVGLAVLLPLNLPPFTPLHEGDRVGWNGWLTHVIREVPLAVVLGQESQEAYLQRQVPSYRAWGYINTSLPATAQILSFSGGDHFYSDRPRIWGYATVARPATWGAKSPEQALAALAQLGISHILFDQQTLPTLQADGVAIAQPAVMDQHYGLEYRDRDFVLYRVRFSSGLINSTPQD